MGLKFRSALLQGIPPIASSRNARLCSISSFPDTFEAITSLRRSKAKNRQGVFEPRHTSRRMTLTVNLQQIRPRLEGRTRQAVDFHLYEHAEIRAQVG